MVINGPFAPAPSTLKKAQNPFIMETYGERPSAEYTCKQQHSQAADIGYSMFFHRNEMNFIFSYFTRYNG